MHATSSFRSCNEGVLILPCGAVETVLSLVQVSGSLLASKSGRVCCNRPSQGCQIPLMKLHLCVCVRERAIHRTLHSPYKRVLHLC